MLINPGVAGDKLRSIASSVLRCSGPNASLSDYYLKETWTVFLILVFQTRKTCLQTITVQGHDVCPLITLSGKILKRTAVIWEMWGAHHWWLGLQHRQCILWMRATF